MGCRVHYRQIFVLLDRFYRVVTDYLRVIRGSNSYKDEFEGVSLRKNIFVAFSASTTTTTVFKRMNALQSYVKKSSHYFCSRTPITYPFLYFWCLILSVYSCFTVWRDIQNNIKPGSIKDLRKKITNKYGWNNNKK